jgi:hypothetical protein
VDDQQERRWRLLPRDEDGTLGRLLCAGLATPRASGTTSLGPVWVREPPWFPGERRALRRARAGAENGLFAALFGAGREARVLLAMQKVEGSNPFSRFQKGACKSSSFRSARLT